MKKINEIKEYYFATNDGSQSVCIHYFWTTMMSFQISIPQMNFFLVEEFVVHATNSLASSRCFYRVLMNCKIVTRKLSSFISLSCY